MPCRLCRSSSTPPRAAPGAAGACRSSARRRIKADKPVVPAHGDMRGHLSDSGFSVISGGGPGIMEAANVGAFEGKSLSIGLNIQLPHEQHGNPWQDMGHFVLVFFNRKRLPSAHRRRALVCMPGGFARWMS